MKHTDFIDPYLLGLGAEIGSSDNPIEGIKAIRVDKFREYAGKPCNADYPGDAAALPFFDQSLDFVASSHVLEHLANPVSALIEWQRVLRPEGYVYLVIPDRRYTFDRGRELTSPQHMIDDYIAETDDTDSTHIDDFVFGIDWKEITPGLTEKERTIQQKTNAEYHHSQSSQGIEINIHFHVFEPENFVGLLDLASQNESLNLNLKLVRIVEQFPAPDLNGFLAILQKTSAWSDRALEKFHKLKRYIYSAQNYPIEQSRLGTFK